MVNTEGSVVKEREKENEGYVEQCVKRWNSGNSLKSVTRERERHELVVGESI